ncbi:MAG: hypothetical protein II305_04370 [Clostridia bacterium]|nr:hypothetical protein [Clostridia bacterium]
MKFFFKYKKQIFSVFLCVALFSCFIGFSFSSSAANISQTVSVDEFRLYLSRFDLPTNSWQYFPFDYDEGVYHIDGSLSLEPGFNYCGLEIDCFETFDVVAPSGKGLTFGLTINFEVLYDGSVSGADGASLDVLRSVIWRSCNLRIYSSFSSSPVVYYPYSYTIRDKYSGDILLVNDDFLSYWQTFGSESRELEIVALYDFSDLIGSRVAEVDVFFPSDYSALDNSIYSEPGNLLYRIGDLNVSYNFIYRPFDDVVQDDLTDIKGSLSGVNNRLDSISSSMNTIDADVNRVNQKLDQTNGTLGDINQGIQDILKPSAPAVDFKNQWNDYFENNPIPDFSALPNYDMTQLVILLDDSSHIIQSIFSPFFLRDYVVSIPLTQSSQSARFDPVAVYISLCFGLSLGFIMVRLLKGSRG